MLIHRLPNGETIHPTGEFNGKIVTVFSGLSRNSLNWDDIVSLANGYTLHKEIPKQFFKSLSKLEISIKHKYVNVKFKSDKILIGNKFKHINIHSVNNSYLSKLTRNFISKIKVFLGRYKKISNKPQSIFIFLNYICKSSWGFTV